MKIQELRQMTLVQLQEKLKKTERELARVRFHVRTGQNQNTAQIKKLRLLVAQIKTLLRDEQFIAAKTAQK